MPSPIPGRDLFLQIQRNNATLGSDPCESNRQHCYFRVFGTLWWINAPKGDEMPTGIWRPTSKASKMRTNPQSRMESEIKTYDHFGRRSALLNLARSLTGHFSLLCLSGRLMTFVSILIVLWSLTSPRCYRQFSGASASSASPNYSSS